MIELNSSPTSDNISQDSLFDGELVCYQHQKGYRFSIDSVLIAHFVDIRKNDRILDLGTGSGIISLILLYRWKDKVREISGIEVQDKLANLARKNYHANNFDRHGMILHGDIKKIRNFIKPESYDKVVCNPPFYTPACGRLSLNREAQLARHQILATLEDFLLASSFVVKNGGTLAFIYPAERICEFMILADNFRFAVKKIQLVYSYPHDTATARLVLIQCVKNGGAGTDILQPFYIYSEKNGGFSTEMNEFYQKNKEVLSKFDY